MTNFEKYFPGRKIDEISRLRAENAELKQKLEDAKYKRCLAMASLCHWKMGVFIYKKKKSDFYYRWHKRWLASAEKFKEGV